MLRKSSVEDIKFRNCFVNFPVSMSLFCLSHSFVYLCVPTGIEARTEVKYKQEYGLAEKGH